MIHQAPNPEVVDQTFYDPSPCVSAPFTTQTGIVIRDNSLGNIRESQLLSEPLEVPSENLQRGGAIGTQGALLPQLIAIPTESTTVTKDNLLGELNRKPSLPAREVPKVNLPQKLEAKEDHQAPSSDSHNHICSTCKESFSQLYQLR